MSAPSQAESAPKRTRTGSNGRTVADQHSPAAALKREVLVESGHRCAIPTCRQFPVQIRHIKEVDDGGKDEFANLIALCADCHERARSGYLTRRSLEQYKASLAVINARYGDLERRVLQTFVIADSHRGVVLPTGMEALMSFLIRDGMVEISVPEGEAGADRTANFREYRLTERGHKLVTRWAKAQPLD